jgi:hypothetical protein
MIRFGKFVVLKAVADDKGFILFCELVPILLKSCKVEGRRTREYSKKRRRRDYRMKRLQESRLNKVREIQEVNSDFPRFPLPLPLPHFPPPSSVLLNNITTVLLHNGGSCDACTIKRTITLLCIPKQSM